MKKKWNGVAFSHGFSFINDWKHQPCWHGRWGGEGSHMRGHQMAQNGQIDNFHGKKGQKVKEINVNMPCNHKRDVTTFIYIYPTWQTEQFARKGGWGVADREWPNQPKSPQWHSASILRFFWWKRWTVSDSDTDSHAKMSEGINHVYTHGEGLRGCP